MAIVGIVAGLIAGGLLVIYASWRWVLFVNVPIGLAVAALTLTTFTHVPWNAPCYTRCGFWVLDDAEISDPRRCPGP